MIKDLFLNKGNVYYATLHSNHKGIQAGSRPVILIGVYGSVVSVIPLTSRLKRMDLKQHVQIKTIDKKGNKHDSNCLLEQLTTIPKEDIIDYYGYILQEDKEKINSRIKEVISI